MLKCVCVGVYVCDCAHVHDSMSISTEVRASSWNRWSGGRVYLAALHGFVRIYVRMSVCVSQRRRSREGSCPMLSPMLACCREKGE